MVGEFSTDEISIDHAWAGNPVQLSAQIRSGPFSRSYYVVSVSHEEHGKQDGVAFPSYRINAELIADLASVWFGKRFDVHGPLQEHGLFWVPALWPHPPVAYPAGGPFSDKPRQDLKIEPTWGDFGAPFEFFKKYSGGDSVIGAFWRATRFYARSLRSFGNDPEVAFFHLIVAIEMLAAGMDFAEDQDIAAENLETLKFIREGCRDGERIESIVRGWLHGLRRKVSLCAVELTNDNFFDGSEAKHAAFRLSKDDLFHRVRAAYDLRSKYAHAGAEIAGWVDNPTAYNEEIQLGTPVMDNRRLARLIRAAPTLGGWNV